MQSRLNRGAVATASVFVCAVTTAACGSALRTSTTSPRHSGKPTTAPKPWVPPPITAGVIQEQADAEPRGTLVPGDDLKVRALVNAQDGWALAFIGNAQYPARTVDGGVTWRIAGPRLHQDAAQGGTGVGDISLSSSEPGGGGNPTVVAWGGVTPDGVVDVTTDGGQHWWSARLPGSVLFVGNEGRELVANVYGSVRQGNSTHTGLWAYGSMDGRRWTYITTLGP